MKTFKLDQNGDIVIDKNKIVLVEGVELVAQTVKQVIGTNLGEWKKDENEGIDFSVILTKNPNNDLIQDTINTAVQKVADTLEVELETDNFVIETNKRNLSISFTVFMGEESTRINVAL